MKNNPQSPRVAHIWATVLGPFCICILGNPGASIAESQTSQSNADGKPTVVLVHGAFAESSSWTAVIKRLLADGYPVVATANPLRGLSSDADYVATIFQTIQGPIVAVGHSYGGSVITGAAVGNPNVKALVYVSGLAPDVGESAADISARFPGSTLGPTLATPVALPGGDKDLYIQQDKFHAQFAADVEESNANLMAATQRPVTESALHEPSGPASWRTIPSWFIFGSLDKNITEAAHSFMAHRANSMETVNVKGASHVVMISHPDEVAQLIEHAAQSPCKTPPVTEPASPSAAIAVHESGSEAVGFNPAPVIPLTRQPQARLILDSPLPEQLARGYVVVRYRAENLRILPVFGPAALCVSPRIGHLHITVDDAPWHWLDASGEPLSINGLSPGPHTLLAELEDPTHKLIDSKTIKFEIPERSPSQVRK
jgi:pimeloyl-ACP methyl ester carboxylesterase